MAEGELGVLRGQYHDVHALAQLAGLTGDQLRAAFRRAFANLAHATEARPLPLEGVDPEQLLLSVRVAHANGLFRDLGWLAPSSAASAVYELISALPAGPERDAFERIVNHWLLHADIATFVALATRLVRNGKAGFTAAGMLRPRVSLALGLPPGSGVPVDALALALISQPDHAREWLDKTSQGTLQARRMAARLIERAAREAARCHAQRDDAGVRALESPLVKGAWDRLLADREALVWRHAARAQGLLVQAMPAMAEKIKRALSPELSPTEWRRGAAALGASLSVKPDAARAQIEKLLSSDLTARDPGIGAALIMGLSRLPEQDGRFSQGLLEPLLATGGVQAIEAFADLLYELPPRCFDASLTDAIRGFLKLQLTKSDVYADDGMHALIEWLSARVGEASAGGTGGETALRRALTAYLEQGSQPAAKLAMDALAEARQLVTQLSELDLSKSEGRRTQLRLLQELQAGGDRGSWLSDLVMLSENQAEAGRALNEFYDELADCLLAQEQAPSEPGKLDHLNLRMRRIRSLLHLVDTDTGHESGSEVRRARRLRSARLLLQRARQEGESPLRRAVLACLARAFDALARDGTFELSDVILCASLYVSDSGDVAALAEASMVSELTPGLHALSTVAQKTLGSPDGVGTRRESMEAISGLGAQLPAAHSPRVSLLRWALLRMQLSLSALLSARSLQDMVDPNGGGSTVSDLGAALQALAQLVAGTRRRLAPTAQVQAPSIAAAVAELSLALEQAVEHHAAEHLAAPLGALEKCIAAELPAPFSVAIMRIIGALKALPIHSVVAPSNTGVLKRITSPGTEERSLPVWLPPNRVLGGFYVLHALGEGGGGSVFVARRYEERDDHRAEVFALKVPEYDGQVSHVLSEADFLKMFREEAGALLALPDDSNLARFVTFDAGVKPKPILVMEHVEGPSLEKLLARRHMDVGQAFDILSGIAKGLAAMHAAGIAHLDVKPANVILRDFWSGVIAPVLVDFGLSGKRLRPGCGTPNYAAPEIWGTVADTSALDPRAADVYAFGCLAYELLTGFKLFDAPNPLSVVAAHVSHDGSPPELQAMHSDLTLRALAEWLTSCMRQKPASRATLADIGRQISFLRGDLEARLWPLAPSLSSVGRPGRLPRFTRI